MAKDVNGKELNVGNKVKALTDGWYFGDAVVVGNVYEVTGFSEISDRGVKIGSKKLFMLSNEIELVEEDMIKGDNMGEYNLTPKLIESLDELKVGDYFRTKYGEVINVMSVDKSCYYPIATDASAYNLVELQGMGAYKVKVEPLEMVEVIEEVKPKLYELVEGEDYVKLEIGDMVMFADGNVHGVHAVDEDDNSHPYCMHFMGESWWVKCSNFLPENVISINGVNIHEEAVEEDPYDGWVEGAKVRCVSECVSWYLKGALYTLGTCEVDGNFGVLDGSNHVTDAGHIRDGIEGTSYEAGAAYKHFELIKE